MRDSRVNLANNVPNEGERLNNEGKFRSMKVRAFSGIKSTKWQFNVIKRQW